MIRLILQFFKENNLQHSLDTLQEETLVNVNTIENRETFIQDITQGKWDTVLKDIIHLNIAPRKLIDLYEQVNNTNNFCPRCLCVWTICLSRMSLTRDYAYNFI